MLRVVALGAAAFLLETAGCALAVWWATTFAVSGRLSDPTGKDAGCYVVFALAGAGAALAAHAIVLAAGGPRWPHPVVTLVTVAGLAAVSFALASAAPC